MKGRTCLFSFLYSVTSNSVWVYLVLNKLIRQLLVISMFAEV